jgi:hypothetical protein
MLPNRQRPTLDQPHVEHSRQAALDRGGAHPRQLFQLLLGAARADGEDRRAALGREGGHDRSRVSGLASLDLDIVDYEPQRRARRDRAVNRLGEKRLP